MISAEILIKMLQVPVFTAKLITYANVYFNEMSHLQACYEIHPPPPIYIVLDSCFFIFFVDSVLIIKLDCINKKCNTLQ